MQTDLQETGGAALACGKRYCFHATQFFTAHGSITFLGSLTYRRIIGMKTQNVSSTVVR
jgi:hypothetical protein